MIFIFLSDSMQHLLTNGVVDQWFAGYPCDFFHYKLVKTLNTYN